MKCIYCQTDNLYKDRTDRRCKKCKRAFAFEPKNELGIIHEDGTNRTWKAAKVTDPYFLNATNNVSENNTLYYTPRQLYYQILRPRSRPQKYKRAPGYVLFWLAAIAFAIVGIAFLKLAAIPVFLVSAGLIATGFILPMFLPKGFSGTGLASKAIPSYNYFQQELMSKWAGAHGMPPRMLPEGGRLRPALQGGSPPMDVSAYSFDRILVCDKAETADMLLANNFHFETNTPIVSIDGYPQDIFPSIMSMVKSNPNLKVFALHDATPTGCLLPLQLRENQNWFPEPHIPIFDVGIRPRQIATMPGLIVGNRNLQVDAIGKITETSVAGEGKKRTRDKGAWQRVEISSDLARYLAPGERKWLEAGYYAELAAIKPSALMRAIYQAFNRAAAEEPAMYDFAANDPRGFFQTLQPGVRPAFDPNLPPPAPPVQQIGQPPYRPDAPRPDGAGSGWNNTGDRR
jgi:hypothetical protein